MGIGGEDLTIVRSGLEIYNLNAQQLSASFLKYKCRQRVEILAPHQQ
ncbi:hypothetical protein QUB70_17065 [Microcoleus sp. A003_D6]